MEFGFSPHEEAFQHEVCDFLIRELPDNWTPHLSREDELCTEDDWAFSQKMARKLGNKGWLSMAWPEEYGGQKSSFIKQLIFAEQMAYRGAPGLDIFGVKMLAPTLTIYGTEAQKRQHLPSIGKGEVRWCEGFSEPDAGSDLTSLKTRASKKEGFYIIRGHKTWTTGAHRADWCFFLARTIPGSSRHEGISFFLVDLRTQGVTVRPLRNMMGNESFSELFFDDVVVPAENLVGGENNGWAVARSLLSHERSGIDRIASSHCVFEQLIEYANQVVSGAQLLIQDPVVQQRMSELAIEIEIGRLLAYRVADMQTKGVVPTYEASLSKVYGSELMQRVAGAGMQLLGRYSPIKNGTKWSQLRTNLANWYFFTFARTVSAGTNEIQRTLVANRGCGLPGSGTKAG